jgi:hypothetical protein
LPRLDGLGAVLIQPRYRCSFPGSFAKNENPARGQGAGSREPSGVGGTEGYYEGSIQKTPGRARGSLTQRPARKAPQDTRSWKPAALLLTGHHAQAPAVLESLARPAARTPAASRRTSIRKPSCLISCSQPAPAGGLSAGLGRQGSQKWGKATRRNNMGYK